MTNKRVAKQNDGKNRTVWMLRVGASSSFRSSIAIIGFASLSPLITVTGPSQPTRRGRKPRRALGGSPGRSSSSVCSEWTRCAARDSVTRQSNQYTHIRITLGTAAFGDDGIGGIRIKKEDIASFFVSHRTVLVTLKLTRQQSERVFRLRDVD